MLDVTKFGNWTLTYFSVTGSSVDGPLGAVFVGGATHVGDEQVQDAEAFGAPGIVFRPRSPEKIGADTIGTEAMAARTSDGLIPLSYRDLRWNRRFPAPKEGSLAFVGYGGGFLSLDDTTDKETRATLYVPYNFDGNGVPAKAMVFSIDPVAESMMMIHGDGLAVVLDKDNGITLRANASTWLSVKPGKIELVAAAISARGSVALGANTSTAAPLLAGAASQPTPSVFFSVT